MSTITGVSVHADIDTPIRASTATNGIRIGRDVTIYPPHDYHNAQQWFADLIMVANQLSARMAADREAARSVGRV